MHRAPLQAPLHPHTFLFEEDAYVCVYLCARVCLRVSVCVYVEALFPSQNTLALDQGLHCYGAGWHLYTT